MELLEKLDYISKSNITDSNLCNIIELAMFIDEGDLLTEAMNFSDISKKIKTSLKKIGLHAESSEGLLQIAAKSSIVLSKFMWYAIKSSSGDKKAKENLIELVKTNQITKEQVLDFLLKLDVLTLHFITGPIHMIDALTGWHIGANIHNSVKSMENKAKDLINSLSDIAKEAVGNLKITLKGYIARLKVLLDLNSDKKILKRSDKWA